MPISINNSYKKFSFYKIKPLYMLTSTCYNYNCQRDKGTARAAPAPGRREP